MFENQSPCVLHPFDSHGAIILAIKFDGENYNLWEQAVRTALKAKNKLGFIDGRKTKLKVKEGEDTTQLNAREIVNSMITSWIINVINPKLHASVMYVESAQEKTTKCYSIPYLPRIHQLKAEIASFKQGDQEVVEFFTKLMGLLNELGNYVKTSPCTSSAVEKTSIMMEQDKVHQIHMGLNDNIYNTVWS